MPPTRAVRAFTLAELLIVIGIIALLIGIVLPAASRVRASGRRTTCLNQMRQIGVAFTSFAVANDGAIPRSSHSALGKGQLPWGYVLMPYLGHGNYAGPGPAWDALFYGIYRCPSDTRTGKWSYGKNVWFELEPSETGEAIGVSRGPTYPRLAGIPRPTSTILMAELGSGAMVDHVMAHFWLQGGAIEVAATRHDDASNYIFVDGHAETRRLSSTFDLSTKIDLWNPATAR